MKVTMIKAAAVPKRDDFVLIFTKHAHALSRFLQTRSKRYLPGQLTVLLNFGNGEKKLDLFDHTHNVHDLVYPNLSKKNFLTVQKIKQQKSSAESKPSHSYVS